MPTKTMSDHERIIPDIPLPGHYGVLTCQLNITRYQAANTGRWVLTVREPTEQLELVRSFVGVGEWGDVVRELPEAVAQALEQMRFLQVGYAHKQP